MRGLLATSRVTFGGIRIQHRRGQQEGEIEVLFHRARSKPFGAMRPVHYGRGGAQMVMPPSTMNTWPVVYALSSLAR